MGCSSPAAWLLEEPITPSPASQVVVGDQQHWDGWEGQPHPPWLHVVALMHPAGLAEDAASLLPPRQIPRLQEQGAERGQQVTAVGIANNKPQLQRVLMRMEGTGRAG